MMWLVTQSRLSLIALIDSLRRRAASLRPEGSLPHMTHVVHTSGSGSVKCRNHFGSISCRRHLEFKPLLQKRWDSNCTRYGSIKCRKVHQRHSDTRLCWKPGSSSYICYALPTMQHLLTVA